MNNTLLHVIEQGRLWDFHGGIHPLENKAQSNQKAIAHFDAGSTVVIPLKQHIGKSGDLLVEVGDKVLKGQPLTRYTSGLMLPVHSPVSGTVSAIEPRTIAHPSGLSELCIVIENDFAEKWVELEPCADYTALDHQVLVDKIRKAGVAGLGGAGFPTARKIESAMAKTKALIINAAECEPYITADDTIMREFADEIVQGINIVKHVLDPQLVIIGIEDNKPQAIAALEKAAKDTDFVIRVVPTKYPSGGEKQLIEILTGMQVPSKGIPADIGIVMHNVGSMYAIKQAVIDGKPLIERVVTVTGKAFPEPRNYWMPIGTLISDVVDKLNYQAAPSQKLIMGGPMMGFALPHVDVPVSKSTNCLLGPTVKEMAQQAQEMACIRCGQCAEVCPARLLPQELQWHAKDHNLEKCEELNISDCIECGACAFVCPSNIPLVHYYRQAKSEIKIQQIEVESAERAKQRFEDRKARLERDKLEREQKHKQAAEARKKAAAEQGDSDAVAAAIARVKQKQQSATGEKKPAVAAAIARAKAKQAAAMEQDAKEPDNSEMRKLREERKLQARAKKAQQSEQNESQSAPKNAAVAAAIARAKAKKAAQQQDDTATEQQDAKADKSAAVAAAVARAKAKKQQAQASESSKPQTSSTDKSAAVNAAVKRAKARKAEQALKSDDEAQKTPSAQDDSQTNAQDAKQAAVAAVARAKARKAAQSVNNQESKQADAVEAPQQESKSDKSAAVAAAVARAKARKAAQQQQSAKIESEPTTDNDTVIEAASSPTDNKQDAKKAAVAAAVARAKARKLAQQNNKDKS